MQTGLDHSVTLALHALEIGPFAIAALIVLAMVWARR
jgi:hypothetical protein